MMGLFFARRFLSQLRKEERNAQLRSRMNVPSKVWIFVKAGQPIDILGVVQLLGRCLGSTVFVGGGGFSLHSLLIHGRFTCNSHVTFCDSPDMESNRLPRIIRGAIISAILQVTGKLKKILYIKRIMT